MEKSKFIKGADFDGEGLALEFVKMDVFTPTDPQYGVSNSYGPGAKLVKENYFVKNGKLKEGESFKYTFKDGDKEREFDNNSVRFFFAYEKAKLEAGTKVTIKRNKKSNTDVEWNIIKV